MEKNLMSNYEQARNRRRARRGLKSRDSSQNPSQQSDDNRPNTRAEVNSDRGDEPVYTSSVTQLSQLLQRLAAKRSRRQRAEENTRKRVNAENTIFPSFPEYASFWVDLVFIGLYIVALLFVYNCSSIK